MALSEIEKLEARFAENPEGRFFAPLADAYRKAKEFDRALELLSTYLPKHPDYLSAHIVLGRCHLDKKDDASAMGAFERVLSLDSENIIALKALAEITERMGDPDRARHWLTRLLVVDPMNSEAEDDLKRLGGPLEEAAAAPAVEAEPERSVSFADLTAPDLETAPMPAIEVAAEAPVATLEAMASASTLEFVPPAEPAPAPVEAPAAPPLMDLETPPEPEPVAPPLAFEPTSFEAPPEVAAEHLDGVTDFDDSLGWGAGERMSHAIHQEDIAAAEQAHEDTTSAFEFMGAAGPPPAAAEPEPVAEAAEAAATDAPMFESVEPEPFGAAAGSEAGVAPAAAPEWTAAPESSTIEMLPVRLGEASEPAPQLEQEIELTPAEEPAPVSEAAAEALPLIMPEDVTPPEEMRRPSVKMVQVGAADLEEAGDGAAEPMLTETMAELYLKQGLTDRALDVYRRLIAQRPDDAALRRRLAELEAPAQVLSAGALGMESVGSFLGRIARTTLGTAAVEPPPAAPPAELSPMEQAFAQSDAERPAAEPADEPAPPVEAVPGQPARQATDAFSLDMIFGGQPGSGPAPAPKPAAAEPPKLGSSFDEFFGGGGAAAADESVRPRESRTPRASEDDLSAFNAWLHGLKR